MPTYQVFELGDCTPYGSVELEGSVRPGDFIMIRYQDLPGNNVELRSEPLYVEVQQIWHLDHRSVKNSGGTFLYVTKHVHRMSVPLNLRGPEPETPPRG